MDREQLNGPNGRSAVIAILVSAALCLGFQLLFGNHNLNLRDEGYLWYGVVGVLQGEVPFLDFQAYDPGRYYWCAAFSELFGGGLVGIRASVALFEFIGITAGLLTVRRILRHDAWMLPIGILLVLWMFPRHKLFEPSITLIAIWTAVRLIERPSVGRHLFAGLIIGLAAFFGRNHGLYLSVAFLAISVLLRARAAEKPNAKALGAGVLGILIGYAPLLWMILTLQGFGNAFRSAVLAVLDQGANLPKGYRWPWTVSYDGLAPWRVVEAVALDISFLLPLLVLPLGLFLILRSRPVLERTPALIAAIFIGVPYVHHFAVCSDLPHLAQAYPPILIGALALPAAVSARASVRYITPILLLLVALFTAFDGHTELKPLAPDAKVVERLEVPLEDEWLLLPKGQVLFVMSTRHAVNLHVPKDEPLFVAPTMPAFYPLLKKRTPVWWIYYLWPAAELEQRYLIEELMEKQVNWALILDRSLNDNEAYDFSETYPLVWKHFLNEWTEIEYENLPETSRLFSRRGVTSDS